MKTKYTKGPWNRRKNWSSDRHALEIFALDPKIKKPFIPTAICKVEEHRGEEALANAQLIAQSPQMIEAIIRIIDLRDKQETRDHELIAAIDAMRPIVEKALGSGKQARKPAVI